MSHIDEHIETAFFGFGGTTKTIPELLMEIGGSAEYMDKALLEFNELRENKDQNKAYYYEGQQLLKKINSYLKRLNNRVSKLTVVYNRETRDYISDISRQRKDEYISPKDIDINKALKEASQASNRLQEEVKDEVDSGASDIDLNEDDEVEI